jgi:tetratricopeptide (TPR) repeat protein
LAESQSDHVEARQMLEHCLVLRRRLGNQIEIAATLSTLSLARLQAGDANEAFDGEREALQIFREAGDRRGEAISLVHLAEISAYLSDDAQSRLYLDQCLAIAREIKHQELEGECELLWGEVAFHNSGWVQAELWFKRSLTVCREAADKRGEANALRWLGKCDLQRGELASARARLCEALRAFRNFEMWEEVLGSLEDFAELVYLEGAVDVALRLSAAAERARAHLQLVKSPRVEQRWQAHIANLRLTIAGPTFDSRWEDGRAWEIDDAVRAALSTQREVAAV